MQLTDTLPQSKVRIGSAYQRRQRNIPDADMSRVQRALLSDHQRQRQRERRRAIISDVIVVVAAPAALGLILYAGEILAFIGA